MFLAVDLGNTSVHFGLFRGQQLIREWRIPTNRISGGQDISPSLRDDVEELRRASRTIVVSSVVPSANKHVRRLFPQAIFVSHRNVGIKVKVKNPAEVGADRLVNALAAYALYKGPCIVIDFGTATTFDVVSTQGEYLGGAIAPGINLARDALYEQTAKLPRMKISAPKRVIGNDTVSAMQSGLVYGYVAMVEGMVRRIKLQITNHKLQTNPKSKAMNPKRRITVIATGGLAKLICKHTDVVDTIDSKLTLEGLRLIGEKLGA